MSDELLTAPMELMAVHSFCFKAKAAARDLMTKRINQIASSRDNARKQVPLVAHAIEELADNKFCMGEHQGSVTIFADSHKALADKMAQARSYLMHGGAIVVREDMNLEAAFWAQLPGNMSLPGTAWFHHQPQFCCPRPAARLSQRPVRRQYLGAIGRDVPDIERRAVSFQLARR